MNIFKEGWFTEIDELWSGVALSLKIQSVLYQGESKYQKLAVYQTQSAGKILTLDGIIQLSEFDEFSYQEMMSFVPLCCHPNPEKVLIIGGGDGGVAREVAKHPSVKSIELVEIDSLVIETCKKYLPFMAKGFESPKLSVHVEDGFEFLKNKKGVYDVIITDSSDPIGPAIPLFKQPYYELLKAALKTDGIVCSQAGTAWSTPQVVANTFKTCKNVFPQVAYGFTCVPTYPNGQIGFVVGSLNPKTKFNEPLKVLTDEEVDKMNLRYYTSEVHRAAFCLPKFIKDLINKSQT